MTGSGPDAKDSLARRGEGPDAAYVNDAPYVNHVAISFDLSEVRIDFGQISSTGTAPQITNRLVTSPANFSRFHWQFCQSMRDYLGEFGEASGSARDAFRGPQEAS